MHFTVKGGLHAGPAQICSQAEAGFKADDIMGESVKEKIEEKKIKERVRLMLFFGTVAEVDDCKFKARSAFEPG